VQDAAVNMAAVSNTGRTYQHRKSISTKSKANVPLSISIQLLLSIRLQTV